MYKFRRRHLARLMAALPAGLLLLTAGGGCTEQPIRVGFSGPLTGVFSDLGVQSRNGASLAVAELNAAGGVSGRDLRLIARDDGGSSPEQARAADRELIQKGVVAVIGHMTSNQSVAALPVMEKAGVPLLSPTTSTPRLSGKKDMFFRIQAGTDQCARALAGFARQTLGLSRINTVWDKANQAYAEPYNANFIRKFSGESGEIPRQCAFSSGRGENRAELIACLVQGSPQAVLIIASARDTAAIAQALRGRLPQCRILASGWAATGSLPVHGGQAVEGAFFARAGLAEETPEAYHRFVERYKRRFGRKPSFAAVQGYHAVQLLAAALKLTDGQSRGLDQALVRAEVPDSFYGPLQLDPYGDALMPVRIIRLENGAFALYAGDREGGR